MEISLGAHVRTIDDHDVGRIAHLILDPETGHVKLAVIRRGFILHEDIEIPLDAFQVDEAGKVIVRYTADQVRALPHFDESRYEEVSPDVLPAWGYPDAAGMLWPAGALPGPLLPPAHPLDPNAPAGQRTAEDLANAVIRAGSDVISRDGEKIGDIQTVNFDPGTGQTRSIVVRRGLLNVEEFEIAGDAIQSVDDQAVYLTLDAEQVLGRKPHER